MDKEKLDQELQSYKIREGPLLKRSKFLKEWRQRWVVLTMNYIITFTNKSCKQVTDIMDLRTVKSYKSYVSKLEEMIPASFKIRSGDSSLYFCAKSTQQKWSWIVSLERLVDYKEVGPTPYNTLAAIKNKGFPSQQEFMYHKQEMKPESVITDQLKTVQKRKQDLEKESVEIAQKIYRQQQQILKERQKLKSQYKQLYNFRQTLQAQQQNKLSPEDIQQIRISSPSISTPPPSQEHKNPETIKQAIITGIFQQFKPDSDQFFGFKFYIDFLINVCTDSRLNYKNSFLVNCKTHKNNKNFGRIFIEFLVDYQPAMMSKFDGGRSSAQIFSIALLSKEMQYFENCMKMVNLLLQEQLKIFEQNSLSKLANKLQKFLLHEESDSTEDVKILLQAILKLNKIQKFKKAEIENRLTRIMKLSKKEEISALAKRILNEL